MKLFIIIIAVLAVDSNANLDNSPIPLNEFQEVLGKRLPPEEIDRYFQFIDGVESGFNQLKVVQSELSSPRDKESAIVSFIWDTLKRPRINAAETYFFHILFRTFEIHKTIFIGQYAHHEYQINSRIEFLLASLQFASTYYLAHDKVYLENTKKISGNEELPLAFAQFGFDYFDFLKSTIIANIIHLPTQYYLARLSLQILQWDLNRDVKANDYPNEILEINELLNEAPPYFNDAAPEVVHHHLQKMLQFRSNATLVEGPSKDESSQTTNKEDKKAEPLGEEVVVRLGYNSLRIARVILKSEDGYYLLDDEKRYDQNNIHKSIDKYNSISIGEEVVSHYKGVLNVRKVFKISAEGIFLLDNGVWFHHDYVKKLIPKYNGISVNDYVIVGSANTKSIQKVLGISSDGYFQTILEGNDKPSGWFHSNYIHQIIK